MRGRPKALLATLLVAASVCCGLAAPAQAETLFRASPYPASVKGEQAEQHAITIQGQKIQCKTVAFTGELAKAAGSIRLTPEYKECTGLSVGTPTFDMNGCAFLLTAGSGSGDNYAGGMHIDCPTGASIKMTVNSICTVHIPPQTPTTSAIDYTRQTYPSQGALVRWTVKGIHSSVTRHNFLCPFSANETDTTLTYSGTILLQGTGGATLDISPSRGTIEGPEEGPGFTAPYPATITGGQTTEHVLSVQGSPVKCGKVNVTAELPYETPELSFQPEYSECTAFGFANSKVEMNGCEYLLTVESGSGDTFGGGAHIECPEGKAITITTASSLCLVQIPEQTPTTNKLDYKVETGSPNKVLLTWTWEGIHTAVYKLSFLCPLTASETDTSGKYSGTSLLSRSGGGNFDLSKEKGYTASSYPAALTGTHTTQHVLEVQGKSVKCNSATSSAELTGEATEMEAGATYSECTAFGFSGASFNTNGCKFVFAKPTFVESHKFTASTSVKCPAGKAMVIKGGNCEALIAAQGPLTSTTLTNMTGSPNTLTAKTEISGLIVDAKSGAGCPLEEKVVSNATYTGVTEFKGSGGVGVDVGT